MKLKKLLATASVSIATFVPIVTTLSCGVTPKPEIYLVIDGPDHSENDKSFNQQGFNGIQNYLNHLADIGMPMEQTEPHVLKPTSILAKDFKQVYAVIPKNSIIVTTGFLQKDALLNAKEELNKKQVVYIDGEIEGISNIASIQFKVEQAAYLGGYALAQYASTIDGYNKLRGANTISDADDNIVSISTFGGTDIPTVTGFMGGFEYGIRDALNDIKDDDANFPYDEKVKFTYLGSKNAHYSGGYAVGGGDTVATNLKNAGVDVILPVAGPQTQDTLAKFTGMVIGVDSKQEDLYDTSHDRFLFSILKEMSDAATNMLKMLNHEEVSDDYLGLGKITVGDLNNGLVSISDTGTDTSGAIQDFYLDAKNNQDLVARAQKIDPNWFYDYKVDWFTTR